MQLKMGYKTINKASHAGLACGWRRYISLESMMLNLKSAILITLLLCSFSAYAVNKCTDKDGKISFQDTPCVADQKAETVSIKENRDSDDTANFVPVYVKIPDVGDAVLFSYKWWNLSVIQPTSDSPPTVKMVSKDGEEPISFSINFIPNKSGKALTVEETADTVFEMASRYVAGSVENEVNLYKIDTTIGQAVYAGFNEQKYINSAVPPGEYSSITVGMVSNAKLAVGFTILTNGTKSKARNEAFNIIGSFQVVPSK